MFREKLSLCYRILTPALFYIPTGQFTQILAVITLFNTEFIAFTEQITFGNRKDDF